MPRKLQKQTTKAKRMLSKPNSTYNLTISCLASPGFDHEMVIEIQRRSICLSLDSVLQKTVLLQLLFRIPSSLDLHCLVVRSLRVIFNVKMSVDVMLLRDHEGDEDHGNPTRKVRCIQNYEYVELLSVTNECVERGKEY